MSDRLPEPTHLGPIAGGSLRASDADREQVRTVLSTAYAEGRLTREEHDERLDQVLTARTFDDLVPLTQDLVLDSPGPRLRPGSETSPIMIDTSASETEPEKLVAIFGGVSRAGRWRIRRTTRALAVFGGIDLDLREAVFAAPVVVISGFWCFGGLDILVPAGIQVRDQTAGIFGGTDVKDLGDPAPDAPTLVIKGVSLFGGVSVRGPKVTEKRR